MSTPGTIALRLAVIVGAATLLAGATGLVMLALRPELPAPRDGRLPASVHLLGQQAADVRAVDVNWLDGDVTVTQTASPGEAPGVWILPHVPDGRAVTLQLRRGVDGEVIYVIEYAQGLPARAEVVVEEERGQEEPD